MEDYSHLLNYYKINLDYIQQNINEKKIGNNKAIINNEKKDENEDFDRLIVKDYIGKNNDRQIIGDSSYNLSFIPNYEIYSYFDLLYSI